MLRDVSYGSIRGCWLDLSGTSATSRRERERERDEDETEAERMPNRLSDEVQSSCENEHVCCPLSRCYPISFGMLAKVCGAREVSSLLPDNYECV